MERAKSLRRKISYYGGRRGFVAEVMVNTRLKSRFFPVPIDLIGTS
jgi:hypothetical protein